MVGATIATSSTNMLESVLTRRICWHYDTCVVLYGNSLIAEQLSCIWELDESIKEILDVIECMTVVFIDVTKCRAVHK